MYEKSHCMRCICVAVSTLIHEIIPTQQLLVHKEVIEKALHHAGNMMTSEVVGRTSLVSKASGTITTLP